MSTRISDIVFAQLQAKRSHRERQSLLPPDNIHVNASSALGCARQMGFKAVRMQPSDPPGPDSLWNFELGDVVEEIIINALMAAEPWPEMVPQREWALDWISGRMDLTFVTESGLRVISEIKSAAEFGFDMATKGVLPWDKPDEGRRSRAEPAGPRLEHILQAAISIWAVQQPHLERDAPTELRSGIFTSYVPGPPIEAEPWTAEDWIIHIIYGRKTGTKGDLTQAEWRYRYARYEPVLQEELKRMQFIVNLARNGSLADRMDYQGNIIDVDKNLSTKKGKYPCSYCEFATICRALKPGIIDIPVLTEEEKAFYDTPK